jgi:hypothetical protein
MLQKAQEMIFACKKCKKCFRKDAAEFEERYGYPTFRRKVCVTDFAVLFSDEFCPHCDNHFVLEAVTPNARLEVEGDDARMDNRYVQAPHAQA